MSQKIEKSKRLFLKGLSTAAGVVAASSFFPGYAFAFTTNYTVNGNEIKSGKIFTRSELRILKAICAIVIPCTDTPGAAEVNTHAFIDNQLFHCYGKKEQNSVKALLMLINEKALHHYTLDFIALSRDQQFQLLTALDTGNEIFKAEQQYSFKQLKELICFGYYTSEVGATQVLRYVAVPGSYKGSIPYKIDDTSWGSKGLFY